MCGGSPLRFDVGIDEVFSLVVGEIIGEEILLTLVFPSVCFFLLLLFLFLLCSFMSGRFTG